MPTADEILEALDPEQREAASTLTGPLCILAGAGTGKTRAITHRIAYGVLSGVYVPQHVLAVTFTARAAGELRSRLRALGAGGVQARTFHAAALRQLQYFWPRTIGGDLPRIAEHKVGLVAEAASRFRLRLDRTALRDVSAEVEWAKVGLLTPDTYAERAAGRGEPGGLDVRTLARVFAEYEEVKTGHGVIDFEDVLLVMSGLLADSPEVARAVRAQYRTFVVDEYQDVSPLQQQLLDRWLGDRREVCVVGDPAQTIYSFTGATPSYLLDFPRRYPHAAVVRLVRDYRSTPEVVALANGVLAGSRRPVALELRSVRESGPAPTFHEYSDDEAEAAGVAAAIGRLVAAGTPAGRIAILFRTNAQSAPLEQALAAAGIGYLVRGGERFFSRREVREGMVLLRGAQRGYDPSDGVGHAVRDVLGAMGWTEHAPEASGALRERWESLQALVDLADEVGARPGAGMADVVAELTERAAEHNAPSVDGVTLASLHAAKGLEWDAVFLVGLSEGLMPLSLAKGADEVEEERRLLYVGVTRARSHLTLSWALSRSPGGRASRRPSRFLDGLLPGGTTTVERGRGGRAPGGGGRGSRARGRGADLRRACRICGAPLHTAAEKKTGRCENCPPTYDEAVFEKLRAWRKERAAATGAPAFVVFTDATLTAIAEQMPRDREGLARIPGVGPTKLDRYGDEVLGLLGEDA